ncbi:hypothetical protein [Paraburkholderia antibiotica]|uniref:Uncharacterized protein n=1 Tax=Paraburkholderia antibiotica TaxID=2728839 RepID=A0A7X9X6C7_9BURK|nr:hypothetical protein [Paraburkholderia antibiotica]NML32339.1 hypothetical protein [Paraburkholderia antibiotica]
MNDTSIDAWMLGLNRHLTQIPPGGGRYSNGRPAFIAALTPQEWRLLNLQGIGGDFATIVAAAWEQDQGRFRALLLAYVRIATLTGFASPPFDSRLCFTDPLLALAAGDEETYKIQIPAADDWDDPEDSSVESIVLLVTKLMVTIEHGLSWPEVWRRFAERVLAGSGAFDRALAETLIAFHTGGADSLTPFGKVAATFRRANWARTRYGALAGFPLLPVGIVELARRKNLAVTEDLAAMLPVTALAYRRVVVTDIPELPFRFPAELDFLNTLLANPETWPSLAAQLRVKWHAPA